MKKLISYVKSLTLQVSPEVQIALAAAVPPTPIVPPSIPCQQVMASISLTKKLAPFCN